MNVLTTLVVAVSVGIILHSIWFAIKTYREIKQIKVQMDFWHGEFMKSCSLASKAMDDGDYLLYKVYLMQASIAKRRYEIETEKLFR